MKSKTASEEESDFVLVSNASHHQAQETALKETMRNPLPALRCMRLLSASFSVNHSSSFFLSAAVIEALPPLPENFQQRIQ